MAARLASGAFFAKGPQVELEQLIKLRHLAANIELFPANPSRSYLSGGYRSAIRGRGMDFEEVRLYQPGDDIRSIDWRVTARTAKAHTKIFREEKDRPVILAIDQSSSLFFGSRVTYKSVMVAQLASLLAWAGLQQNDKVGGIIFNNQSHQEIKPLRNKHAVLKLLEAVTQFNHALFDQCTQTPEATTHQQVLSFPDMLEKLRHIAKPGSAVFLISDFMHYDTNAERILHLIKRHTDVYALIVADTLEKNLPAEGNFSVTDGLKKLRFSSHDKKLHLQYTNTFDQRLDQLQIRFKKLRIPHRVVWTHDDPYKAVLGLAGK